MSHPTLPQRFPIYYGWVNVVMAAVAMTATLPGRTHGIGLITKSLLEDLRITESAFAEINLWSSLLGAGFCVPMGYLIDRYGVRMTGTVVTALLALCVWRMSVVHDSSSLLLQLTLIRGLGQSALSIISIAMIGKWFRGRLGPAMGVYSVLLTFGFIGSILGMGWVIGESGWRVAWQMLAWSLVAVVPVLWLVTRNTPESCGLVPDSLASDMFPSGDDQEASRDYTVWEALRTPAFWIFVLGTSAFNLVWSSITLFNESILGELGFDQKTSVEMLAYLTGMGLITNLIGGKFATRERTKWLLGAGLAVLAVSLMSFPSIKSMWHLRLYGSAMGCVGGLVTVVHFAAWGHLFGRHHLGRIQGVAQVISVLASAVGPLLMAWCHTSTHSYMSVFYTFAAGVGVLSVATLAVAIPKRLTAGSDDPWTLGIERTVEDRSTLAPLQPVQD